METQFQSHWENLSIANTNQLGLIVDDKSMYKLIFDAWEEFLKAFSFASRSLPELREFLRASYEAGNFRALSNMEDVLESMNGAISSFKDEELAIAHAIKSYAEELQTYKTWAINF